MIMSANTAAMKVSKENACCQRTVAGCMRVLVVLVNTALFFLATFSMR